MPLASHVLLLPDVVFLVFEQLSTSARQRARLVCRTWNGVFVSLKGTSVVWSPTTLDGEGEVRELEESLSKSPAPLTSVDIRLPNYPLGLSYEQRRCLQADLGQLFDRALDSLLSCQTRRQYGFRLAQLRISGWMESLLMPLPYCLSNFSHTKSLETLEILIPHRGDFDLMAVLCALPQLRIFHLSATDPSSWPHCLIEMAEKTDFYDSEDRTQSQCYSRLERLQVSNFQFYVEDLIRVLERCPQLEDLQLVGSLSGSWGVSGKSVFIAHCARLRSLHITPSAKMSTITPIYRDFQDVVSKLPKLTRLGIVYQAACTDTKTHNRITHQDTLATIQQTMSNLTWLYLAEPSWTKPTTCESILPFLHDMPHLEYFYAPFSFVDMDQLAITKKHRRHVEPWVSPRLKVLDLGFTNTLYGNASWMHGEHHPTLRTRDIFEFIGRTMPNLVHLRLRLFSGVTFYPDGGMHYLGWLDKLETLVVVARTTVAHYDEWKVGMFEWLGKPPTPAPEPGSIFYTGVRKPKSKVTTKVKSWLLHSTNDMDVEKKEEDAAWDYGFFDDLALPNLKRFHIQLFENSLGGVASNAADYVLRELEKCIRELRKDDKLNVTVEEKRWEKSNMIFHRPEGNVIVSRDSFDE